ncbi:hypothetical protein, conserved [Eimeria tenella]|uniref:Uncharacterized protein n=1 Tax=Eimeria tenella TaxID=5802 RepID=U6KTR2_EIMTE|nr:hypothetical protein, conserved [Eimeria tenella]CDJ38890.1 hypothetical protein, conserved [Eimeria tenella]|eukprot:XP_013229645.1 hypothetical protein, conserved [Eimeria tenella]
MFWLQIFGRLAGASAVGSALCSPWPSAAAAAKQIISKEMKSGEKRKRNWSVKEWLQLSTPSLLLRRPPGAASKGAQQQQPWELLFAADGQKTAKQQGLTLLQFAHLLPQQTFKWPTTLNTGQAPLTARFVPVANKSFLSTCRRMRSSAKRHLKDMQKFTWKEINEFVQKETICKHAIGTSPRLSHPLLSSLHRGRCSQQLQQQPQQQLQHLQQQLQQLQQQLQQLQQSCCACSSECVFRSFCSQAGADSEQLHKEDVLRCIWKLAPVDGLIEWEQFLYFLEEAPGEGLGESVD